MMKWRIFTLAVLWVASVCAAGAHTGFENNTEVRIFSNEMRIVFRTSHPFAWALLGEHAPPMADEAGQAVARPFLIEAARGLFKVTAGGIPLPMVRTDCFFEVENDVALVLCFERPRQWPVVMEAKFMNLLTSMDTGSITVYDYTASRFIRDLKPIVQATLDQRNSSISFSLETPAMKPEAHPGPLVASDPESEKEGGTHHREWLIILVLAVGVTGHFVLRRWRCFKGKAS